MDLSIFPKQYAINAIRPGSVFKMVMGIDDGITPKHNDCKLKKFVVLSVDENSVCAASLIINSNINKNFPNIVPYQQEIFQSDYDFLTKGHSFIDGYTLHEFSIERIIETAQFEGEINEYDLSLSVKKLQMSGNVKPFLFKKYKLNKLMLE